MTGTADHGAHDRGGHDRAFFGHPRGLGYLAFSEGWTAFSYYGMQSLLVLYMTGELLKPGPVARVLGFRPFHGLLESLYGPLPLTATATAITGLYVGLNFAVPILGGLLADRLLGRSRTVILGAALMTAGHFLMSFHATFLIALACILIGSGCFNANVRAQIGELYAAGDTRRADAFQLYVLAVNLAVIVSPLICGGIAQARGYHWGFVTAGIGMALGLAVYLAGRRWMPAEPARRARDGRVARTRLTPGERRRVLLLIALLPVLALVALGNMQIFNAYLLWGQAHYALVFFGRTMPVAWLLSLDAFVSTGCLLGVMLFWRWWSRRRRVPDEIVKLAIGAAIAATAPLILAAAATVAADSGGKVGLGWGLAFHIVNDIGFANVYPVGLALYSRGAPPSLAATMVSVFTLNLFLAATFDGWLGGFLDTMPGARFWLIHAGLVALGAGLLVVVWAVAGRTLAPGGEAEVSAPPAAG